MLLNEPVGDLVVASCSCVEAERARCGVVMCNCSKCAVVVVLIVVDDADTEIWFA